ncbi:MAG: 2-phosphosulfolactate phosphatase [Chloroflexota bacterium]
MIHPGRQVSRVYDQDGYRCRLEWGRRGARVAAERGDVLVVVDVLSFSTAAVTAVQHGGIVVPCAWSDDPAALGARIGAEAAVSRYEVPQRGRFSLSPPTMTAVEPGTRVVLASPNGATCSRFGREVPHLLVGALVNARATAEAVAHLLATTDLAVTVLACGERWREPNEDGELRFAIEDYLGAGAIIAGVPAAFSRSPEARLCEGSFRDLDGDLAQFLFESGSGRELRAAGFPQDVEHAARLDVYDAVPAMHGDELVAGSSAPRASADAE